jgi:hypothetical protein
VVSGINLGGNQGYNILYSGTVSGATEGALALLDRAKERLKLKPERLQTS